MTKFWGILLSMIYGYIMIYKLMNNELSQINASYVYYSCIFGIESIQHNNFIIKLMGACAGCMGPNRRD